MVLVPQNHPYLFLYSTVIFSQMPHFEPLSSETGRWLQLSKQMLQGSFFASTVEMYQHQTEIFMEAYRKQY